MSDSKKINMNKSLHESAKNVLETNTTEGTLPPWLKKFKKGKKDEKDEVEEAADEECSCDEADDLPWCDDCKEKAKMESKSKSIKEEDCSCDEEDDLPYCDDCEEKAKMESKSKSIKEEDCSCDEEDDLPYCDDCEEKAKSESKKVKEHLAPLFAGETLSEDFRTKAETIFSAIIAERVDAVRYEYATKFEEAVSAEKTELAEKVDEYLSYVVEEWYKENKIAVERSLRAEITENFVEGLRNLFTDNFITIPENKIDVLEAANEKIDELTSQVNNELKSGMEKAKKIADLEAQIVFTESVAGLTLSETEKLKTLASSVEFDSIGEFKTKLNILKETYFKSPTKEVVETLVEDNQAAINASLSDSMVAYTRSLANFRQ